MSGFASSSLMGHSRQRNYGSENDYGLKTDHSKGPFDEVGFDGLDLGFKPEFRFAKAGGDFLDIVFRRQFVAGCVGKSLRNPLGLLKGQLGFFPQGLGEFQGIECDNAHVPSSNASTLPEKKRNIHCLTNAANARTFVSSVVNPTVRLGNLCYRRNSAHETGAIFVSIRHPAMAGGRGYKGRKVTNNSACPVTGFQPPATSGAMESLVGDVQSSQETSMTAPVAMCAESRILSHYNLKLIAGEPRVHDLRLGEALGFADKHKIRTLVARNIAELKAYGEVSATVAETLPQGGRPSTEYHLNEAQALLICMFARTERAAEVRKQVIEVFMAWRRGETPQTPPQAEYVPVLSLAQQIMLSNIASARFMRAGDDSHREEILEHVFLALHSFEPRREMTAGSRQCDEVTL